MALHRGFWTFACCLVVFSCPFLSVSSKTLSRGSGSTEPAAAETKCLAEIAVTRGNSPWRGFTSSYEEEQAGKEVKAEVIDAKTYSSIPSLVRYDVGDGPLLGRSEERRRVVVNKKFFSDLKRVDATRIGTNESKTIGKFLELSFASLTPRTLVRFLLDAEIVETYWHLESKLCLVREVDGPNAYLASFSGVHSYCTNECSDDHFQFALRVDKRTGELVLSGI